jgi:hypothetical protein
MTRTELAIVVLVVVTAFLAYLVGYDAGWNTKREPDSAWRDRMEPEGV